MLERHKAEARRLGGEHLKTHIATRALLTAEQIDRYVKARGYTP